MPCAGNRGKGEHWRQLVQRNMQSDWSWEKSAVSYIDIYNKMASY